jgi:peptide/nickel transport system permease protein
VTLPLVLMGMVVAVVVSVPLGVLAAVGHRRASGTLVSGLSQVGIAVPAFWAGLLLITVVAVRWGLLPAGGFTPWGDSPWEAFRSLLLPAISLAIVQAAILTRYVRSAVLEVMREDYIRTARAKGLSRWAALRRHGLRNAAIPVLTVLGLQLTALLVGAVVIENVFTLPGLGKLLLDGINSREIILVLDIVMILVAAALVVNLLVDVLYVAVDPRLRRAR